MCAGGVSRAEADVVAQLARRLMCWSEREV